MEQVDVGDMVSFLRGDVVKHGRVAKVCRFPESPGSQNMYVVTSPERLFKIDTYKVWAEDVELVTKRG